jgi:hypothetical protein
MAKSPKSSKSFKKASKKVRRTSPKIGNTKSLKLKKTSKTTKSTKSKRSRKHKKSKSQKFGLYNPFASKKKFTISRPSQIKDDEVAKIFNDYYGSKNLGDYADLRTGKEYMLNNKARFEKSGVSTINAPKKPDSMFKKISSSLKKKAKNIREYEGRRPQFNKPTFQSFKKYSPKIVPKIIPRPPKASGRKDEIYAYAGPSYLPGPKNYSSTPYTSYQEPESDYEELEEFQEQNDNYDYNDNDNDNDNEDKYYDPDEYYEKEDFDTDEDYEDWRRNMV